MAIPSAQPVDIAADKLSRVHTLCVPTTLTRRHGRRSRIQKTTPKKCCTTAIGTDPTIWHGQGTVPTALPSAQVLPFFFVAVSKITVESQNN
jgi:hypothetical protein